MDASSDLLRVLICGSVDDGKSTLLGRLLYDTNKISDDQLEKLKKDTKKHGRQGDKIDFSLLVDGLQAEREQSITIDVAYRYLTLNKQKLIVLDTPGHKRYTRNMASAASRADIAILLVDAKQGLLEQTKRHCYLCDLFGVDYLIIAINKMDEVNYSEACFDVICADFTLFANRLQLGQYSFLPISALEGDNLTTVSNKMSWYKGSTLLDELTHARVNKKLQQKSFFLPIQWINKTKTERHLTGNLLGGSLEKDAHVLIMPQNELTTVGSLQSNDSSDKATDNQAVSLTVKEDIDISRGNVICSPESPCQVANQFQATIIWCDTKAMVSGRQYLFKMAHQHALCRLKKPKYRFDPESQMKLAAETLELNDIGSVQMALDREVNFLPYNESDVLGGFVIIDRLNFNTVACGMIKYALYRATNVKHYDFDIDAIKKQTLKGHESCVIWMTGLSSAGKSTIANLVEKKLYTKGIHTTVLDGDNIRHGLNRDLGFTEAERAENIRRIAEVAKLMCDAGLITLVSFISPYRLDRESAKNTIGSENFYEVFIDVSLEGAEKRDVKGLYKKARSGQIANFTGVSSPYEPPLAPDLHLETEKLNADRASEKIIELLITKGIIPS